MDTHPSTNAKESRSTRGKALELAHWMESKKPVMIAGREWEELRTLLAPISESYLRRLLRDSGVALAPLVEGVRQESLDALETSLVRLLEEYEQDDRTRRDRARKLVIAAKEHARWASRREENRAGKREMILWMTTWLENPPLFREWVRLRRAAMQ